MWHTGTIAGLDVQHSDGAVGDGCRPVRCGCLGLLVLILCVCLGGKCNVSATALSTLHSLAIAPRLQCLTASLEPHLQNSPDQRELIHMWGSVSVPRDVILAISVLAVNLVGLSWLLWQAPGLSALTPAVWIKWGHESIKDLVVTATLLSQQYLRTCEDGYVMGWSIAGIEFEVESCGKIIWRVLHLLSSGYLLWEDGFSTFAVDIMVYFRLRSSWRILGLEIAKRLSRADVTMQIDQLYPQTKLTETDDNQCPICWEEMPAASVLPCKHRFHRDCLRDWVKEQGSCPTCRHPINMIAPPGTHLRDGVWHETLRRLFSLGGPTPQEIEQMTLQLHRVFPNVAIAAIEHDLVLTGSVEVTADRLTRGQVD